MTRDDPDETEGRALYRAQADAFASAQVNMAKRRVSLGPSRDDLFAVIGRINAIVGAAIPLGDVEGPQHWRAALIEASNEAEAALEHAECAKPGNCRGCPGCQGVKF